jgi:hypothetical protein
MYMSWFSSLWKCGDSHIKITLKSDCFKYRKVTFNLHNQSQEELSLLFDEIKALIAKHNHETN